MNLWIARLSGARDADAARVATLASEHGELLQQTRLASRQYVLFRSEDPAARIRQRFSLLPGIEAVHPIDTPYVLSSRGATRERTRVRISAGLVVGGAEFVVMAGPCAVESRKQTLATAEGVRASGARVLRGGCFKPRTSPFSFRGLGRTGLEILQHAGRDTGLPVISEAMDARHLEHVIGAVDIVQIGMRNALNYCLLEALGQHPSRPPVLLKRGIGTSLDELLCAADYVLAGGNPNLLLCLRGTLGARNQPSRASLNIADIPALRQRTHLPIIVDPSHVAGDRKLVPAICAAAVAAGADGLLIEVHRDPERALVDGPQSLTLPQFAGLMRQLRALASAVGRTMAPSAEQPPGIKGTDHAYDDLALERPPCEASHDPHETGVLGKAEV